MNQKEICIKVDAAQRLENLLISYNKAQNALDKLVELRDIPCSSVEDLDIAKIKDFVQANINIINTTPIFTEYYKIGLVRDWEQKKAKAIFLIRDIKQLFTECQGYAFSIEEGIITPETSLEAIADAQCTKPIPEEAFTHFELIESLRKAIRELREFEKAQNLRKINITDYISISEETLAEGWASGWLQKIDPKYIPKHRPREERGIVIGRTE